MSIPGQSRPPGEGGGLLHSRWRFRDPPPQDVVQVDQGCQSPQLPWAGKENTEALVPSQIKDS